MYQRKTISAISPPPSPLNGRTEAIRGRRKGGGPKGKNNNILSLYDDYSYSLGGMRWIILGTVGLLGIGILLLTVDVEKRSTTVRETSSLALSLSLASSVSPQSPPPPQQQQLLIFSDEIDHDNVKDSFTSLTDVYKIDREAKFQLYSHDAPVCTAIASTEDISITLVTQLSHDRLWMMEYHCTRYPHLMAIAVYSNNTQEEVMEELHDMGCPVYGLVEETDHGTGEDEDKDEIEDADSVEVDSPSQGDEEGDGGDQRPQQQRRLMDGATVGRTQQPVKDRPLLKVAVLDAQTHGAWDDYPVNELRNLALSLVQTNYIIYIDVDFWPSENLYETIVHSTSIQQALINDPRIALVIPAFALFRQCSRYSDCREKNVPKMPYSLVDLKRVIDNKKGSKFDPTNRGGHGSTKYIKWFEQATGSLVHINCLQSHRYEPFVMIRYCRDMPPFQSSFSGYGKNKVTWMIQVMASGYTLHQVGGAYLVHYPHLDSSSRRHWNEAPPELLLDSSSGGARSKPKQSGQFNIRKPSKPEDVELPFETYKRGMMDKLFVEFRQWVFDTIPSRLIRTAMCRDAQDDDSKLWIAPELKELNRNSKAKANLLAPKNKK